MQLPAIGVSRVDITGRLRSRGIFRLSGGSGAGMVFFFFLEEGRGFRMLEEIKAMRDGDAVDFLVLRAASREVVYG